MTVPPPQQVHLIQISLKNLKLDNSNTAELDRIGDCLTNLRQSHGHISDIAKRIDIIANYVTSLKYPKIPIGLGRDAVLPDIEQSYETALTAADELWRLVVKAESH